MDWEQEIMSRINSFTGQNPWSVFGSFLQIETAALRSQTLDDIREPMRKEFREQAKGYSLQQMKTFMEIHGILCGEALGNIRNNTYTDMCGRIYHIINMQNSKTGQFFTPQHIADLTSAIAVSEKEIESQIHERGYVKLAEPASGGGAMVLGVAKRMQGLGYNPQRQLKLHAYDIDKTCCCMTYVQMALYGIPAVVFHGDSLSGKIWDAWPTLDYLMRF